MSEQHDEARALQVMVEALRAERAPDLRWEAMESRLIAQITPRARVPQTSNGIGRAFGFAAAAAAVVLGIALNGTAPEALSPPSEPVRRVDTATVPSAPGEAGQRGALDLRTLAPGDVIEAGAVPVQFTQAGLVQWTLAPGGRIVVRRSSESRTSHAVSRSPRVDAEAHVVALERGSIHAEVTPRDPSEGWVEPFAVEAGGTRVAVHGTAFRVTLMADEIVVDVEHGTVAIGPVGRTGITLGRVMVGPSRAAFSLDGGRQARFLSPDRAASAVGAAPADPSRDPSAAMPVDDPASAPGLPSQGSTTTPRPASAIAAAPDPDTPSADLSAPRGVGAAPPAEIIAPPAPERAWMTAASVRAGLAGCFARTTGGSPSVQLSIRSTFTLKIRDDGSVQSARFDPPLKPEFQACAAELIGGRFERGPDVVTIPLAFGP